MFKVYCIPCIERGLIYLLIDDDIQIKALDQYLSSYSTREDVKFSEYLTHKNDEYVYVQCVKIEHRFQSL